MSTLNRQTGENANSRWELMLGCAAFCTLISCITQYMLKEIICDLTNFDNVTVRIESLPSQVKKETDKSTGQRPK